MADNNIFGQNLRRMRKARKMSQIQLAAKLNMQGSAISRYELGRVIPGITMIQRLAVGLGLTVSDMVRAYAIELHARTVDMIIKKAEERENHDSCENS